MKGNLPLHLSRPYADRAGDRYRQLLKEQGASDQSQVHSATWEYYFSGPTMVKFPGTSGYDR